MRIRRRLSAYSTRFGAISQPTPPVEEEPRNAVLLRSRVKYKQAVSRKANW